MPKSINIICNEDLNYNRLKYTIDFINNHPLKPVDIYFSLNSKSKTDINLIYSSKSQKDYHIPTQLLLFSKEKIDLADLYMNQFSFNNSSLYSVENQIVKNKQFIEEKKYSFDILEAIFYHISRFEETQCSTIYLDIHKRMKIEHQLLYKNQLHRTPVVDNIIFAFLKSLELNVENQITTYSLTHDIDIIRKYNSWYKSIKSIGKAIQMRLGFVGVKNILQSLILSKKNIKSDPYYTFDWLFSTKGKFKDKIVYFVTGGNNRYDLYNSAYLRELPDIISKASKYLYKIGFHPSYLAYVNDEMFKNEYKVLNDIVNDNVENIRMHYLRLDIQKTFELFEKYNLKTDSSLGYPNDIGFRCGTGFRYYPYNFKEERAWNFTELPLVLMDSALLFGICDDNVDCFKQKLTDFLHQNRYNTHITFNFHNSTFDNSLATRKGLKEIFLNLFGKI